jgi:rhodanese-related sulfurtransferase
MNFIKTINHLVTLVLFVFFISCSGGEKKSKQVESQPPSQVKAESIEINAEAKALLSYLDEMGDYVNGRNFPSLIKASSVYDELAKNNLIIDLRDSNSFAKGHIEGAVNVEFNKLPEYFTNDIKPFEFDRIIMVCYTGQMSSYSASLLRLMGYGNIYAMRWGMSGWNKDFATDYWLDAVSSAYEDQLESEINEKAAVSDFPKMKSGETSGEEIMNTRFNNLFEAGFSNAIISAEKVFEQPENYYTINYDRRDKYEAGHIPGSIRYKPNGTLGIVSEMQTIPADKEIVIYCGTGHNSGFVTAYLRLFGYDAKTLTYGNNSFMYNKMVKDKSTLSWLPFSDAEIGDYPVVL